MAISQPSYPVETNELVTHIGAYVDSVASDGTTIDTHATVYVAVDGDDGNDGLTWGTAKLTIPAGIAALPLGEDDTTPIGAVELGAGEFAVSSYSRTDTVGVTNGDATITDASITTDDVGAYVINPSWFAAGAYIVSVVPGVSFEISNAPTNTGASVSAVIHRPAVRVPANVTLRGQGASGIKDTVINWSNLQAVTKIQDNGTGITVAIEPGTANNPTAVRGTIEKLAIYGNSGNVAGLWSANLFQSRVQEVDIAYHGVAGIAVSGNWEGGVFQDLLLQWNGSETATIVTGGFVNWGNSPTAMALRNIFFLNNAGFGAYVGHNGCAFYDCTWGYIFQSDYSGAETGVAVDAQGGDLGPVSFDNCEFDLTGGNQHVTVRGQAVFKSCLFQGGETSDYAVVIVDGAEPVVFIGCIFYSHPVASIFTDSGNYPCWLGCTSTDPLFITSDPSVAASAALGLGTPSTTGATGASPPFAISDTTDLQDELDSKPTALLDTDTSLTANSDTRVASQKAVKAYVLANAGGGGGGGTSVDRAAVANVKAWTWDPALNNNTVTGTGGVLLTATIVVPDDMTISKIHTYVAVGGSTLTVAYGALWTADGTTLIAKTASQTSAWDTNAGHVNPTLVAESGQSLDLTAGVYIVGVIGTGATSPQFASWNTSDINYANMGAADPAYRMAYLFPADNSTTTLTGLTAQLKAPWMGLS